MAGTQTQPGKQIKLFSANEGNLKSYFVIMQGGQCHRNEPIFIKKAGNARPTNLSIVYFI
jgi:hypothetical protein